MIHASELFHPRSKGAGIYIINFQIHWSRDVLWALTQCFQHATFPGEGTGLERISPSAHLEVIIRQSILRCLSDMG